MASLDSIDEINVLAMAGTWLGAIIASFGLFGFFIQLRSFLSARRQRRRQTVQRIADQYARLIESIFQSKGLSEGVAPAFAGWVQGAYKTDHHLAITQDDRGTGGTSSWSRLLAQCDIKAQDMLYFGGPTAKFYPALTGRPEPRPPPQTDLIVEESRVLYGFSPSEFAALLIICGFSPTTVSHAGTSTAFLGRLQLVEHGPFSQQAQFDAHHGALWIQGKEKARYRSVIPVKRCIDYALGLLWIPRRGGPHNVIVIPRDIPSNAQSSDMAERAYWLVQPPAGQLRNIRYNLEQLVSMSGADLISYNVDADANAMHCYTATMDAIAPAANLPAPVCHAALLAAHALATLHPWPVLPVLPAHFVRAFLPLVRPFVGSREATVQQLQAKLREDPELAPIADWDSIEEQSRELGQTGDVRAEYFSGSASTSRVYHDSMMYVFEAYKVDVHVVRMFLAAAAVWKEFVQHKNRAPSEDTFIRNMMMHLNENKFFAPPVYWAVTVYATFLWGWLNNYLEIEDDFTHGFRRRIFLA